MDFERIGCLIRLRYKLMWARTRTRNGKIVLFVAGYMLLVLVAILFGLIGAGGGLAAVKLGKAERIAQGVLTAFFATATATSVMLGYGLNAAFSDAQLRRYPLSARDRMVARHFTGAVDPFWFLFLALDLGLAFGLYLFGASNLLFGIVAVLLLFVCNYLLAQVVALALDRLMQQKGGSFLLPIALMAVCMLPGTLVPVMRKNPAALHAFVRVMGVTPSFGAGSLMAGSGGAAIVGFASVVLWIAGLAAALVILERRPPRARAVASSRIHWDTPFERFGALLGGSNGPLVTYWLQFFFRCRRFKLSYLMSLPLLPFLLLVWTRQSPKGNPFGMAVGVFCISGLAPAAAFVVNQFGYVGYGLRRFFLFPMDPGVALRASSYTLLALSSVYVVTASLAWSLFGPREYGPHALPMLIACGIGGLFAFHAAGLWTTLYGARRADPNKVMGNDLSLAGNIVVMGGMMTMLMGPLIISQTRKNAITPERWPYAILFAGIAFCVYAVSVTKAPAMLSSRREKLLAVLEGRS